MPELPEVETMVRTFRPRLEGRRITDFQSRWKRNVAPGFAAVRRALTGRVIVRVGRRAKFITWALDDGSWLLIHLRMSGRLEWGPDYDRPPDYVRAYWQLEDERLLFCDARKFGRISHTRDFAATTQHLGLEPLDRTFTADRLATLLHKSRRQLKPFLLDQAHIAGLGNIYADESLFAAGLHPLTPASALSDDEVTRLHTAIRQVLRKAIRHHGSSIDWMYPGGWMQHHLNVYARTAEPCRRCGHTIERLIVGQRGTHVCPVCQPRAPQRGATARRSRRSA
jgi:formamidopyrimidine-DNA glycosylase